MLIEGENQLPPSSLTSRPMPGPMSDPKTGDGLCAVIDVELASVREGDGAGSREHPAGRDRGRWSDELMMQVVEQVMRSTADEVLVCDTVDAVKNPDRLRRVLGQMVTRVGTLCERGCPLLTSCGVGELNPWWRDGHPPVPGSLWEELELLRVMAVDRRDGGSGGAVDGGGRELDPWTELMSRRRVVDSAMVDVW